MGTKVVKEKVESKVLPLLWAYYDVQWDFITQLCGSVPGNPDIIETWLKARMPKVKPVIGKVISELASEVMETVPEVEEEEESPISLLVFQRDNGGGRSGSSVTPLSPPDELIRTLPIEKYVKGDGGLVMRGGTIRSHLKDCARVVSYQYMGRVEGEKAFSTKVINGLYVDPIQYWIPVFKQDGTRVMVADGNRDKPIHVRGPRGEAVNALKNFEYVMDARLNFTLMVLGDSIKEEELNTLMSYGGVHGYGGERGDGEGKYIATIIKR